MYQYNLTYIRQYMDSMSYLEARYNLYCAYCFSQRNHFFNYFFISGVQDGNNGISVLILFVGFSLILKLRLIIFAINVAMFGLFCVYFMFQ